MATEAAAGGPAMADLHDQGYLFLLPAARRLMLGYAALLRRLLGQSAYGLGRPVRERTLVAAGPIAGAAGSGFNDRDADQLMSILSPAADQWPQLLSNTLMPALSGWLGKIPLADDHPAVVTAGSAWRQEWLAERTQVLLGVPGEVSGELRTELSRLAAARGTDVRDAKAAAQSMLDGGYPAWANRAQLIARTEVVSANNQGMLASWRALAGTLGGGGSVTKTWVGGTRPTHSAVSGTTIGIDEKFQVGASEMTGPGDGAGGAGEVCNCVVGDTAVDYQRLRAVTRRWYEGEVITLSTAAGHELTVTPNHPVLRADGRWVAANLINEGDYLISGTLTREVSAAPHVDGRPPKVAELYGAANLARVAERVRLAAPDFHGDATADGEVEVVPVDGCLLTAGDAATDEQVAQFGLTLADLAGSAFSGLHRGRLPLRGSAGVHEERSAGSAGGVGGCDQGTALSGAAMGHPLRSRRTSAPGLNASGEEPTPDRGPAETERRGQRHLGLAAGVPSDQVGGSGDPVAAPTTLRAHHVGVEQHHADRVDTGRERGGESEQWFAGSVALDRVVRVERRGFAGHVYNLDTGVGWYLSNGVACRNCKCSLSFEVLESTGPGGLPAAEDEEGAAAEGEATGTGPGVGGDAAEPAAGLLEPVDYLAASDDDLAGMLSEAARADDEEAMNRVLAELDRRDAETEQAKGMSAEERAKDAEYNRLISQGSRPDEAFEQVYGTGKEVSRTSDVIARLRASGYTGRNFDELTMAVFKEEADRMYWVAEQETNGFMLSKAAERAGVDPRSLFTGQESRARKYASDELLGFWQQHTRITVEDVRAGMLGGTMRSAGTAAWL